jgi:hypothetical protein
MNSSASNTYLTWTDGLGPGLRSTPYLERAYLEVAWSEAMGVLNYYGVSKTLTGTSRDVFSGRCRIYKRLLTSESIESTKSEKVGSDLK